MPADVLIDCKNLSHGFGGEPLFRDLSFNLLEGDHVALVGPNGSGKSTLLKILAGQIEPDAGERRTRRHLRVGYVPQDPIFAPGMSVEEVLLEALAEPPGGAAPLDEAERYHRLALALGKVGFDDRAQRTESLSGGWRKRLGIARELALAPDVLLLDEPTNHLDVESIVWLEGMLRAEPEAFLVVSHDRYFLQNVARRVLELDRRYAEGLLAVEGTYDEFLEARDERLRQDEAHRSSLANLARRELEWLRRGPKARTTKARHRVDSAHELLGELAEADQRRATRTAGIDFTASGRRTQRLWSGRGLAKSFGGETVLAPFDLLLKAGTRLGVVGRNGSGKTTLLRLLVGDLEPDQGEIDTAEGLRVVYYEQNRESLDPEETLQQALAPHGDHVQFQGNSLHVASWARRFLFRPEQLRQPVGGLSGGEKARIVLARLMLRPADLLVLDEPTNDLDIPTLDVLEEALLEFTGAVVLVTHDRFLLDRVTTSVLALDGEGGVQTYADVAQWLAARKEREAAKGTADGKPVKGAAAPEGEAGGGRPARKPGKLTYNDQREFDGMEEAVLAAEAELEEAQAAAADAAVATDHDELRKRAEVLEEKRREVERLYDRWAELEEKKARLEAGEPA